MLSSNQSTATTTPTFNESETDVDIVVKPLRPDNVNVIQWMGSSLFQVMLVACSPLHCQIQHCWLQLLQKRHEIKKIIVSKKHSVSWIKHPHLHIPTGLETAHRAGKYSSYGAPICEPINLTFPSTQTISLENCHKLFLLFFGQSYCHLTSNQQDWVVFIISHSDHRANIQKVPHNYAMSIGNMLLSITTLHHIPLPTTNRLKVSRKCLKVSYTVLKVITRDNDRLKTS